MKIGFTGTREGLTPVQKDALYGVLEQQPSLEFHHGCCVGADADAVQCVTDYAGACIVGHPCNLVTMQDESAIESSHVLRPDHPPLERNRHIVDACDLLIACPKGPEELRSGTWSTVRYARKRGKQIAIIYPDGKVTEEGAK